MLVRTAKEYRMLDLEDLDESEYNGLKAAGMLWEYFPEASGSYSADMRRIDVVGQNGNDGTHYGADETQYRVAGDDNPDGVNIDIEWPHRHEDGYAEKIEKLYDLPKDGIYVDDYDPNGSNNNLYTPTKGMDMINNPSHYELGNTGVEAIDVIEAVLTKEQYIGYLRGNIMKYQLRANKKNNEEDLKKADIYSGWLVEVLG